MPSHRTSLRSVWHAGLPLVLATPMLILAGASFPVAQPATTPKPDPKNAAAPAPELKAFSQSIPSAAFKFDMLPIPASADGKIKAFYLAKTELTWEAFDVYVYRLDVGAKDVPPDTDAVTRPSKPYLPPDRGFGHEGFPAITMSYKNATEFCKWLSAKSGRAYRLPTEDEWEYACRAGAAANSAYSFGDDAAKLADYAWSSANAESATHPVAKLKPNAWGLYDMHGNVMEWVTGRDSKPVTKGGCYRDTPDKLKITARAENNPEWNDSDPQIPKSQWWLADGPFVGFRVVCEVNKPATDDAKKPTTTVPPKPEAK